MKLAIPVTDKSIKASIDDRFGRAEYFLILDLSNDKVDFYENEFKDDNSGAGQKVVSFLNDKGVQYVITPELGPKAKVALKEFDIIVYKRGEITDIKEAIEAFKHRTLVQDSLVENMTLRKA